MFDAKQLGGVVDCAVTVAVVADSAVEEMVTENTIEGLSLRLTRAPEFVTTLMPAEMFVAHALTRFPPTSTMQVSQVWIGPSWGW